MSLWQPVALSAADEQVALKPETGVETRVYASLVEPVIMGTVSVDSGATVTFTPSGRALAGGGEHLVLRVATSGENIPIANVDDVSVALDLNGGGVVGTATLDLASYSDQRSTQMFRLTEGRSVDLTDGVPTLITAVDGTVNSSANLPASSEFTVMSLPDLDDFFEVGCAIQKSGGFAVSRSVNIPCGYNAQAFTKKARSAEESLSISYRYDNYEDGLAALNGGRCVIMLETKKDNVLVHSRTFYTGVYPNVSPPRENDDDEVVVATMESGYEKFLVFTAA
jgi:hypothetical protein